ncbi:MAG: response regulator transcription factor [Lachnospiraceae bacterium]|nr:response regulator transcription factor [Lachnospiraceae bacterium]
MYHIALCDDETGELEKTEQLLKRYCQMSDGVELSIERFESADDLLKMVRENSCVPDIIFMDIFMPGKLGIDAVKELRQMGSGCLIVFLTMSSDYALEAFRVDADQYLLKPVVEKELFEVFGRLLGKISKKKKYLALRIDNRIYRVALHDIVYCEAQKKCQHIYLADGAKHILRMTMARIFDMLSDYPEFVKVGISYIVNLEHVDSLDSREIHMDNGGKIYIPRGSYHPLMEKYFDYYCDEEV